MRPGLFNKKFSLRFLLAFSAILTLLITSAAGGYFLYLDRGIERSNRAVHRYVEDVSAISDSLSRLRDAIGYGGFIHDFKNYVIRRDDEYARNAATEMDRALGIVDHLAGALEDASAAEHLVTVRSTILEYRKQLEFAVGQGRDLSVTELDAIVKVDDGPAQNALAVLDEIRSQKIADDLLAGDESTRDLMFASELGFVLVGLIAVFGGFTLFIVLRTNKALKTAFSEIDVLIEGAPNAILCVGETGLVERCNQEACRLFDYQPSELTGMHVDQLVPAGNREAHARHRNAYLDQSDPGPVSNRDGLQAVDKTGREFPVEIDLSVIRANGSPKVVAFVRDVSDLHRQREELIKSNKKAMEASEAKSHFMAIMSHELRTPLNAVIGFSELVQMKADKGASPSELANYAKSIARSGKDLLSLINDILDFAKIDSGRFDVAEAPFYLPEVLSNIYSGFAVRATENGVDLKCEIAAMDNIVLGDAMRIKQVLFNLLDNAIKFGRGGAVEFDARTNSLENSTIELVVSITDHGIGIAPDRISTIFDPFHQADARIAREFGGTGLGLSISRSLARLMGGDIVVKSELGKGSTFTATFVLHDLQSLSPMAYVETLAKAEEQDNDFGLTVLVVDDVELNLNVAETVLMDMGCIVVKARNGEEAVKWCRSHKPDVILMDIHMPGMNGIDAAARIMEINGQDKAPPVFAWTADVTCGDLLKSTETPWLGIITKPTSRSDLIAALVRVTTQAA